jgi:8-oxo-dGTP pyrophosphatase MutT (NUDIX family)
MAGLAFPVSSPIELPPSPDRKPAAVLCLLFERAGEAQVVLTRRAQHLSTHRGEVAFPGGRLLPGEPPLQAALREANEEVALDPSSVELIGQLTPLTTLRSQAVIHCFVGSFPDPVYSGRALVANRAEVDRVFWAPLARLAKDGTYHEELWPTGGNPGASAYHAVPFFELGDETVWGVTGRLLADLLGAVLTRRLRGQA